MEIDQEPQNRTLFQAFEWHTPSQPPGSGETHSSGSHYHRLTQILPNLSRLGITSMWLPPGCKAMNRHGNGYDIYDIWDLGQFDQKGARPTRWGSREELDDLLKTANNSNVDIIWDTVLSHKAGADETQEAWAVEVDPQDRRFEICPPRKIDAWLRFNFPGRAHAGMPYSELKWHAEHFNGTDWDHRGQKRAIFKLISDPPTQAREAGASPPSGSPTSWKKALYTRVRRASGGTGLRKSRTPVKRPGKGWADDVDDQHGNNDFLMFSNIDYSHPDVRNDIRQWGTWMIDAVGVDGFRLDAAQHISYGVLREWIRHVDETRRKTGGKEIFVVGEVWTGEVQRIVKWLQSVQPQHPQVYAFDAPLLYNFSHISEAISRNYKAKSTSKTRTLSQTRLPLSPDLRKILQGSLISLQPHAAVTVVTNHDTQPGQTSATPMDRRLKPLFYAFILLRQEGLPCVFWGDLFGTKGPQAEPPVVVSQPGSGPIQDHEKRSLLADLIMCRKLFAYGRQTNYFDSSSCIGWTRSGSELRDGCAVVLSIEGTAPIKEESKQMSLCKKMRIGKPGEIYMDILGHIDGDVVISEEGYGSFPVRGPGLSVFVRKNAPGIDEFPVQFDLDVYGP